VDKNQQAGQQISLRLRVDPFLGPNEKVPDKIICKAKILSNKPKAKNLI